MKESIPRRASPSPAGKPRLSSFLVATGFGVAALAVAAWLLMGRSSEDGTRTGVGRDRASAADRAVSSDGTPDRGAGARSSVPDGWALRWRALSAELASDERTAGLIALLEEMVADDPLRALALARAEADPPLREKLLFAVLCAWARSDPDAAAAQARALPEADRVNAVAAVLTGAAHDPATAVRLAEQLCRDDPARAREYGYAVIAALAQIGEYRTAVRFAVAAEGAAAGEGEDRLKWIQTAFSHWARQEPEYAALATLSLPDAGSRYEALLAVVADWVRIDPAGLTEFVQQLPAGADRTNTLGEALRLWVNNNPKAAADWIDRLDPSPELDAGVIALATLPQLIAVHPEVAVSWAESIDHPGQRSNALTAILRQWAGADPAAARRYVEQSVDLLPADRAILLASLTPPPS
jgi:hypothetical protein